MGAHIHASDLEKRSLKATECVFDSTVGRIGVFFLLPSEWAGVSVPVFHSCEDPNKKMYVAGVLSHYL